MNARLALRIRIIGPRCPSVSPFGVRCQREIGHMLRLQGEPYSGQGDLFEMHSSDLRGGGTEGWWDLISHKDLFSHVPLALDGLDQLRMLLETLSEGAFSF